MSDRSSLTAPAAPETAHELRAHGDVRADPWFWLRNRDDPAVLAHLEAENRYTDAVLGHLEPLRAAIVAEIRARVRETDTTAPVPHGAFDYFTRTEAGKEHPILCRRPRGARDEASGQVVLDANREAQGHAFFELGSVAVSPDHRLLAYAFDTSGGERYTLRVRDIDGGHDLADRIEDVYYGLAWAADSRSIWFVRPDDAVRPFQVWHHVLGGEPTLVLSEDDERFFVDLGATRSGDYAVVAIDAKTTSERWLLSTHEPDAPPRLVASRRPGIEYEIDHQRGADGGRLLIITNDDGPDFRLVTAPVRSDTSDEWRQLLPHQPGRRLEAVDAFDDFVVVSERSDGNRRLRVLRGRDEMLLAPPSPAYTMRAGPAREPDATVLRYEYSSLTTPLTSVDADLTTGETTVVKRVAVEGGFDLDQLTSERLWARAADGEQIPISVVRLADRPLDGSSPMLLSGYGSYETSNDPAFSHARLSLLERGVAFAIAHVRGGGEMGRAWYEGGRLGAKPNTFTDFIRCAEHLVESGYTSPDRLVARGRSAGGLLMGAIANMRPDLFAAIVAEVPFVDVLTTMADPTIPLTVTEWDEWGDPVTDPDAYAVMRSYSPYDNVTEQPYPAILATAGLNDSRVQYWEPAKWVQRLRTNTTSDAPILLRADLGSGHAGPSGRYESWREEAFVLAFVLDRIQRT